MSERETIHLAADISFIHTDYLWRMPGCWAGYPIALQHTCLGNVRWPSRIPIFRTAAFECNISELKPRMRSYGGTHCRHCAFNCQGYTLQGHKFR